VPKPGAEPVCAGGDKGRTLDTQFPPEIGEDLLEFFRPFDEYLAKMVLKRPAAFDWNFGREFENM